MAQHSIGSRAGTFLLWCDNLASIALLIQPTCTAKPVTVSRPNVYSFGYHRAVKTNEGSLWPGSVPPALILITQLFLLLSPTVCLRCNQGKQAVLWSAAFSCIICISRLSDTSWSHTTVLGPHGQTSGVWGSFPVRANPGGTSQYIQLPILSCHFTGDSGLIHSNNSW